MLSFKLRAIDEVETPAEGTVRPFADEDGNLCLMDADRNVVVLAKAGDAEPEPETTGTTLVEPRILGGYFNGATFDKVAWSDAIQARIALGVAGASGIVDELPDTDLYPGRSVFLTTDERTYTYKDGAWRADTAQPAGSNLLVGAIPGTNPNRYMRTGWNPDGVTHWAGPYGIMLVSGDRPFGGFGFLDNQWGLADGSGWSVHQQASAYFSGGVGITDFHMCRPLNMAGDLNEKYQCEANKTYEFSMYTNPHRCTVQLCIAFQDASFSWITGTDRFSDFNSTMGAAGADDLVADYTRLVVRATAPSNARYAVFFVRKSHTNAGPGNDSYLFMARPMACEVPAGQTDIVPWSPPPPGLFYAETIIANSLHGDKITFGSISGAKLAATSIISLTAQIGDAVITGAKIGYLEVDTLNIKGNAVTAVLAASTAAAASFSAATWTTIQSITISTLNSTVEVMGGAVVNVSTTGTIYAHLRILRNGVDITGTVTVPIVTAEVFGSTYYYCNFMGTIPAADNPGAGTHLYELQLYASQSSTSGSAYATNRYLSVRELKK